MKIGSITIEAARDGAFLAPAEVEYHRMPAERWDPYRDLLASGTHVVNELGAFVIRDGERIALVDLGFGPAEVPGWNAGGLMRSLAALGIAAADVTDVLFSHLHFDHIGWASVDGGPTFPNAVHRWHEADWQHFMGPGYDPRPEELFGPTTVEEIRATSDDPAEAAKMLDGLLPKNKLAPLADRAEPFAGPGEVLPGIEVVETPGHSPGHVVFRVRSRGETGILAGDIAHHQAELVEAHDWQGAADADVDADEARRSRLAFCALLVETGEPFTAAHFIDWEWGHVERAGDIFAWRKRA